MSRDHLTRRRMVQLTGAVAASAALAGCGSSSDPGSTDTGGDADGAGGDGGGGGGDGTPSFDGWFDQTESYDGVADETGASTVTVEVGTGSDGLNFGPPAVRVDAGTTVSWEWNGKGGSHNVVAEDGSFESDLVMEEGHTFEHTFDAAGEYKYFCQPHKTMGMKGVVVVE